MQQSRRPDSIIRNWFAHRGWREFPFQREVWDAYRADESGLLHCTTGAGKTFAIWFAALREAIRQKDEGGGLRVLWLTPLRALAADTTEALAASAKEIWPQWSVDRRTGDTSAYRRRKIAERPPEALVTTPESISVLLSQPEFLQHFRTLQLVVVDEWHELLSTKRGVLTELALARLRSVAPSIRVWGLSATLGNIPEAALALGGYRPDGTPTPMRIVRGRMAKRVRIETLMPPNAEEYPWGGHLGLHLLPGVIDLLKRHRTSIVFTNTRSQAELWFRALEQAMPEWNGRLGLHHGSLSNDVRLEAETGLRSGEMRAVVATSSLDLGVDFAPVDAVLQIGSPKGVARLMQRAGRSGHQPGAESIVYCVPTNTLELVEIAAARDLALAGEIESRQSLRLPLDLLCQHLTTVAIGGFRPESLRAEIETTHAYRGITESEWAWALDFASRGGDALKAYPQFARIREEEGMFLIRDDDIARKHRLTIGTISSDASVNVQYLHGKRLGSVEESFIARLRPGDRFLFAGKSLELINIRDQRAYVRPARSGPHGVPRWMGGRLPLSSQMAGGMRERLHAASEGVFGSAEMERIRGVLDIQASVSRIPRREDLLIERFKSREGYHLFLYPFAGRLVHEGLAALFAFRLGRREPLTFSLAYNDYGMELLSSQLAPLEVALEAGLFSDENLVVDILGSMNAAEMARRQFRGIARVSGLTQEGIGRARKSARQLMVSASLLYDVFRRYEPGNLLLGQATREVLENQLEQNRLQVALAEMRASRVQLVELQTPSPFSSPLFVERFREKLSSEELAARVARMEIAMEKAAPRKNTHA